MIGIYVALFFFGMLMGCAVMGLASTESYNKGYYDGYETGRSEKEVKSND